MLLDDDQAEADARLFCGWVRSRARLAHTEGASTPLLSKLANDWPVGSADYVKAARELVERGYEMGDPELITAAARFTVRARRAGVSV